MWEVGVRSIRATPLPLGIDRTAPDLGTTGWGQSAVSQSHSQDSSSNDDTVTDRGTQNSVPTGLTVTVTELELLNWK